MLRGIRKASANWLGRTVMAVVMGLLAAQLRGLGHQRHFPRLRPLDSRQDRQHRNLDRAVPAGLQRPPAADRPPARPSAAAGAGRGARPRPAGARRDGRRGRRSISARTRCGSAFPTPKSSGASPPIRHSRTRHGHFDRVAVRAAVAQRRLHRAALHRRAAAGDAAPADRRLAVRRIMPMPKAWLDAINQFQNQERSIEYVTLGPAQAGDIPQPTDDELNKYFEDAQVPVPGAGIPQDRRPSR